MRSKMSHKLHGLSRSRKLIIAICIDLLSCMFATFLSQYVESGYVFTAEIYYPIPYLVSATLMLLIFRVFDIYRSIFRYIGWIAIQNILKAVFLYSFIYSGIVWFLADFAVVISAGILQPVFLFYGVLGSRYLARTLLLSDNKKHRSLNDFKKILIYGAGSAGRKAARSLENCYDMKVIAFLDDDKQLHGRLVSGINVFPLDDLGMLVDSKGATHLLLAIPSLSRGQRTKVLKDLENYKIIVRSLPSIREIASGEITVSDIRELEVEDLLAREVVEPDKSTLAAGISGKKILVTGGGGSIGSEICRQLLELKPKILIIVDNNEYALYSINANLQTVIKQSHDLPGVKIVPRLGSVQDSIFIEMILSEFSPEIIFHAAAFKHVPLVEDNIEEALKNNVFGTLAIAQLSIKHKVSDFVLISSDKAVRPTNVMGASKRLAEMTLQAMQVNSSLLKLSMVRFGNVLESSGSVIPIFRAQIAAGGPLTVTHPNVTRYFMTIPEAAQLVIQVPKLAKGGDVFVLDMGEPVRIIELARKMIKLAGFREKTEADPTGEIEIQITGLRPGEKLYEELLIGDEPETTSNPKIFRATDPFISWNMLVPNLDRLCELINEGDRKEILKMLSNLVDGFAHSDDTYY